MSRWRIAIAEDHAVTRHGLRVLLGALSGAEVVGDAATGAELLELCARYEPNLVLTDLGLPDMDGFEVVRRVKSRTPEVAVLVMSVREDGDSMKAALAAGASGYLPKSSDLDQIEAAIRFLEHERLYIAPGIAGRLVGALIDGRRKSPAATAGAWTRAGDAGAGGITGRERQVLRLLGEGRSARGIGSELGISERTVTKHLEHIYRKIGTSNRVSAVRAAMRMGLVDSG